MKTMLQKMLQKKKFFYFLAGIFICVLTCSLYTQEGKASNIDINDRFTENGRTYQVYPDGNIRDMDKGLEYKYNSTKKTYSVCYYWGEGSRGDGHVVIPNTLKGKKITAIDKGAFAHYDNVKTVKLGKYITVIGQEAFYGSKLTDITLPEKLQKIGKEAFYGTGLKTIKIPANVSSIGAYAFYGADKLTKITMPKGKLKALPEGFASETAIKEISLPVNITKIGTGAFSKCKKLEKITIKGKVKTIPDMCFYKCSALKSFSVPKSVTRIGQVAYSDCNSLKSIVIPGNIKTVENGAFRYCDNLKKVEIKSSLKVLEANAFTGCKKLTSVTISGAVQKIRDRAFAGCTALKTVTLSNAVGNIENRVFEGCRSLYRMTVSKKVKTFNPRAFDESTRKRLTIVTSKNSPLYKKYYESKEMLVSSSKTFGFTQHTTLMVAGETKEIAALNYDQRLKWKSSNSAVVRITSSGKATAVTAGNVILTAKSATQEFTLRIRVLPRTVDNIMRVITTEYVRPEMSDYEKVVEANAWMIRNVSYDWDNYVTNTIPWSSFSGDGTLMSGVGVCQGYAMAFQKIMDYYQIPCRFIASVDMNHGWNAVQIGGKWYHVDTTWNDPMRMEFGPNNSVVYTNKNTDIRTEYLLVSDSEIRDHYGYYPIPCITPHAQVDREYKTASDHSNVVVQDSPLNPYLNVDHVTLTKGGTYFRLKLTGTSVQSFASQNKNIATVTTKGAIQGRNRGTTNIVVKGTDGGTYTCRVKVEAPKISKTRVTLNKGAGTRLSVAGTSKAVSWRSSNSKIATVSSKGYVKALSKGTVKITATVDGRKLTCQVKVHEHSYKVKTTKATCTKNGKKVYTCSCGKTYTKKLKALGHDYKWFVTRKASAYKATCEADFGTRVLKCSRCGKIKATESVINIGGGRLMYGVFSNTKAKALFTGVNKVRADGVLTYNEWGDATMLEILPLTQNSKMSFEAKMQAVMYAASQDSSQIYSYPGAAYITYTTSITADSLAQGMGYDDYQARANVLNEHMTKAGTGFFRHDPDGTATAKKDYWVILVR